MKMVAIEFTARRAVFALGVAIATIAAPVVMTLAGSPPAIAPRILAGCTSSGGPYDASLDCEPNTVEDLGGAPGEMQLTDENEGNQSAESPAHGR